MGVYYWRTMDTKRNLRRKRKRRIRAKITGTSDRPRLVVFRSNRYLQAQIVDDTKRMTLAHKRVIGKNKASARILGHDIATIAKQAGISAVVFDRGGYRYHGAIKELAQAVREEGLQC